MLEMWEQYRASYIHSYQWIDAAYVPVYIEHTATEHDKWQK